MTNTPIDVMVKWIPDKLYPCPTCTDRGYGGWDEIYRSATDLLVIGESVFCRECVDQAESLLNILVQEERNKTDLKANELSILDGLSSPMYACTGCWRDESIVQVKTSEELTWCEGEGFVGFLCDDCICDRYDNVIMGPVLSKIIKWDALERKSGIKLDRNLKGQKEIANRMASQKDNPTKTILVYGYSDDIVYFNGCVSLDGDGEYSYDCTGEDCMRFIVGDSIIVTARYGYRACWEFGISQAGEDANLPEWPIRIVNHHMGYSVQVEISDVPEDKATVRRIE